MDTVVINTQPTADKNVAQLKATLGNFDFMGPLRGPCLWVEMQNPSGVAFDGQYVRIDGPDWQNWPCDLTDEEDTKYLSDIILRKVGLDYRHELKFTTYPQYYTFETGNNYTFSCEVESYPAGNITYQWNKDGAPIADATTNTYSITNAQEVNTGIYSVVVSNPEFVITGNGSLTSAPIIVE